MIEPTCRRRPAMNRFAWPGHMRALLTGLVLLPILAVSFGAGAVPQVGGTSFVVDENGSWSDAALGSQTPSTPSPEELQALVSTPGEADRDGPRGLSTQDQDGGVFSVELPDLLLISPTQALDRWSATCTPDPVMICREAHANAVAAAQGVAAATKALGISTKTRMAGIGGPVGAEGGMLPVLAIVAVLLTMTVTVIVIVARGVISRRRLETGWV